MYASITALLDRHETAAHLLGRMAQHTGIDLAAVSRINFGMELTRLMRTCRGCPNRATCQQFMAGNGPADHRAFCPNAGTFDRLRNLVRD